MAIFELSIAPHRRPLNSDQFAPSFPELASLGYKQKALETLHAVVANRRHRVWSKATEKMTLRFLDLCVELRKSDLAKDGLFQYRITSIQVPNSLELVIKYFLQRARDAARYVSPQTPRTCANSVLRLRYRYLERSI